MNKPLHPYPYLQKLAWAFLSRPMAPIDAVLIVFLAIVSLAAGCMAYKSSTVNLDITSVIAGAGAAANQAEQAYQAKTIAQTPTARNTINNLGAAYEQARTAYIAMLTAEESYQAAEKTQLNVCSPPPANIAYANSCPPATQATNSALTKFESAQRALNSTIANLANQTKAVQALSKK